ncbi:putative tRNA-(MS[2]IO[6]A)-hydroxylase [Synechococcus sp. A18-25c]|uniref:tRNA-(ms[2]io[6]A)-hydroxylase n=1 Tax=unclassified Synechococcus TaxID=2626047 RepID=UPI00164856D4|nr:MULTISPECIES: tRNA-(ms[2]io[6]A)-hydroxylase [unclassified Synechococcus]MEC7897196.1 tRNA-(ms[2]io[6]A)-hydroxylase [Cyanobacteriota bacterium]QNI49281.1 putative tRNA-(MS[2]IO[6]A)-hydroxylase [Synechococcus sp. A15-60]QNJ20894.1 putative tRNA-(MS[2]IO[6]A)-hydroxylase [Synechococcus sp. A18-25c]|tara:strand:- start:2229 stop:2897 length:669 start_codon:yes stop_codon:yes gene_type:complete
MTIAASTTPVEFKEASLTSTVSSIRWLAAPTSRLWVEQAIAKPMQVLIDHAHCERKAAGSAVQLMFRYLCEPGLGEVLSPLAREELAHFEQVLDLLKSRGRYLEPLRSSGYGADLAKQVRRGEPDRMLDSFLVAGLIEARSHERMALLAEHSPDQALRTLYGSLLQSEARHFGVYWVLCEQRYSRDVIVPRLQQLAQAEVEALCGELVHPDDVRMHSVGVDA